MADVYRTAGSILLALAVLNAAVALAFIAFASLVARNMGTPEALMSAALAAAISGALYLAARGCAALAWRGSGVGGQSAA